MDNDFDDLLNVEAFNLNDFNDEAFLNSENFDVNLNNIIDDINMTFGEDDVYERHTDIVENNAPRYKRDEPPTFDYLLSDNSNKLKVEPSISSGCNTDDSSSAHSSPMARVIKKRDYQTLSSNNVDHVLSIPTKIIKEESITPLPRQIIKYQNGQTKTVTSGRQPIFINTISSNRPNVVQVHKTISAATSNPQYGISKIQNCNIRTPSNNINGEKNIIIRSMSNIHHTNSYSINNNNNINNNINNNNNNSNGYENNSFINQANNFRHRSESPLSDYDRKSDYYGSNKPLQRYYETNSMSLNKNGVNSSGIFQHPIPQTGTLVLTDEEKRTLAAEGFSIPTRLPLTKQDERNLKKVRRKIKNKISAQESRRKKKEYVDSLEKRVEQLEAERLDYKRKLDQFENANRCLNTQLRQLQQQLNNLRPSNTFSTTHNTNNTITTTNTMITSNNNTTTSNHSVTKSSPSNSMSSSSSPSSTSLMIFLLCFVFALCGGGGSNNYSMAGWGYRAQMRPPNHALITDMSLLNRAQKGLYAMEYDALQHNLTRNMYALTYYHNIDYTKPQHEPRNNQRKINNDNNDGAGGDNNKFAYPTSAIMNQQHQQQRPSVLLGDDNGDDLNFEEWIKNYKVGFICNRNNVNFNKKSAENNSKSILSNQITETNFVDNQSEFEFTKNNQSKSSNAAINTDSYYDSYYKIYTSYFHAMTS